MKPGDIIIARVSGVALAARHEIRTQSTYEIGTHAIVIADNNPWEIKFDLVLVLMITTPEAAIKDLVYVSSNLWDTV